MIENKRGLVAIMVAVLLAFVIAVVPSDAFSHANAWSGKVPAQAPPPVRPILLTDPVQDPKQDGVLWFPPTGHTLRGSFLTYWQQNGGLAQFGYPLTEEFFEPVGPDNKSVQVQYFERNRFEHHPENQPPYDVLLGTLGREFHPQDPPASQPPSPALYFPESGHNVSGAFLQYWQTHGGLPIHGYPITEAFQEKIPIDGKTYTVQYFERSRFELHPENAGGPYEVLLGLLGRQLSEKKGYPYGWYPPYGHAADKSWLAGRRIGPRFCMPAICSCIYLRYDINGLDIQQVTPSPESPGLAQYYQVPSTGNIVVFGTFTYDKPDPICLSPNYYITGAQSNPSLQQ